jgi:hypothetical protein
MSERMDFILRPEGIREIIYTNWKQHLSSYQVEENRINQID